MEKKEIKLKPLYVQVMDIYNAMLDKIPGMTPEKVIEILDPIQTYVEEDCTDEEDC